MTGGIVPNDDLKDEQPFLRGQIRRAGTGENGIGLSKGMAKKRNEILHSKVVMKVVCARDGLVRVGMNEHTSPIQDVAHSEGAGVGEDLGIDIRFDFSTNKIADGRHRSIAEYRLKHSPGLRKLRSMHSLS